MRSALRYSLSREVKTLRTAPQEKADGILPLLWTHKEEFPPAVETALAGLETSKAEDIVSIDIRGKSPLADCIIVASGRSHRHVTAIAEHILRVFKEAGLGRVRSEGLAGGDWVLVDGADVIVHVFRPEVRAFYNIEKIWQIPDLEEDLER